MKRALLYATLALACNRNEGASQDKKNPGVVVVEADGGAPAGPKAPEKEPNDNLVQAQMLVPGQVIEGHIDKPKDTDLYKFAIAGADRQTLHVELTGVPDLDLALDVLDQTGARLMGVNDGKVGEPETLAAVTLSPGTYLIRVRESVGKGAQPKAVTDKPYYLSWRIGPVDPNSEQEPNDKPALATPIAIGQALSAQLAWRHDEDYFKVLLHGAGDGGAAAPPSVLRIDVGGLDDVALTVQVMDSIGGKLLERKAGKGEPISLRNVGVKATEPFYLIVVRGSDRNPEGRYSVHVAAEQTSGGGAAEQEPNDDKAHATPIQPGTTISGFLAAGDQDFYKLTLPSPQIVRAEVTCPERVNIKIAVHDAGGMELYHVDEGGRQEPEVITDAWLPAGDSYLRVYAGKGESNTDQPYQLSVRTTPDDGTWEHEPNNSPPRATPWPAGAPLLRGMISPKGDEDWFRVPPAPGGTKGIVATVRPIERVDLQLFVADDAKNMVKAAGSGDAERVLRAPVDPGKSYFLVVKDARGKQSNPRDSYELHLTFE
jgi:hypothetical protein